MKYKYCNAIFFIAFIFQYVTWRNILHANFSRKFLMEILLNIYAELKCLDYMDMQTRIWDMRMLGPDNCLAQLDHPRVVTAAYFSPFTGNKIMTTCLDNRIRVWDNICAGLAEPSREIVHSHNFNRYITSFKAEWDPKDRSECLAVIGRYISDHFDGALLHPIDFLDVSNGRSINCTQGLIVWRQGVPGEFFLP
jgi:hypothetical protein